MLTLTLTSVAHAADDEYANIHSVGIISALGHTATLTNVGFLVFDNTEDKFNIDDWGIDDLVIKQISTSLADRFTVKTIDYDKEAFSHPESNSGHNTTGQSRTW